LQAREDFLTTVAVSLRSWDDLEEASWWCVRQWREQNRQSRRRLDGGSRRATFEFGRSDFAIEFLLKFGAAAQAN
jgi:hypothetical protein